MDWTILGGLGSFGLFVLALVGFLNQLRETRKARHQSSEIAERTAEAAPDVAELKEGLAELRKQAEAAGVLNSFDDKLREFGGRLDRLQESIWSAMAVTIDASHRPIVGAGMMRRHVPGFGNEPGEYGSFVVDIVMLVEALAGGAQTVAKMNETPGAMWPTLGESIGPAEERGLVKLHESYEGEVVGLTEKGRALSAVLQAQRDLPPAALERL